MILSLYSALVKIHLESCMLLWGSQHKQDMDLLEGVQNSATKMIRGLEHIFYDDRLRELDLFSTEKKALGRPSLWSYSTCRGLIKIEGEGLFIHADSDRTKDNGFNLKEGKFKLDVSKKVFTQRVVKH